MLLPERLTLIAPPTRKDLGVEGKRGLATVGALTTFFTVGVFFAGMVL